MDFDPHSRRSAQLSPNRELTVGAKILCSWRLGWGGDASLFIRTRLDKEGRVRMNPARISRQQPARTTLGTEVGDGSYTVAPPGSDTVKKKKKRGRKWAGEVLFSPAGAVKARKGEDGPETDISAQVTFS